MKRIRNFIIAGLGIMTVINVVLTQSSCMNRELYDEEIVDTILTQASPVDRIDTTQTWVMTTQRSYTFTANVTVGAKTLQILTENPRESGTATVVNQTDIEDGATVSLSASYPLIRTKLYAALVDAEGTYTVAEFSTGASKVDFSNPAFVKEHLAYTPQPQTFAYCYELEMPEPGDYDYNDVVLHISMERVESKVIRMNVQLAAVDCDYQVAAALRLIDYGYDEIEEVKTENDNTFNKDIPSQLLTVMTKNVNKLLLKGQNNEAVINLFADAHWATGDNLDENYGVITRKKYNVTKNSDSKSQLIVPRTISYLIYFKDGSRLNDFTLDTLDPFVIKPYNGANWEIHLNEHRFAQTLYNYQSTDLPSKHLPWALKVPTGLFRHPLKGVNIGFYYKEREALFGAYSTKGHAFGTWSSDHTQSLDWYLYPQNNSVF